jgi:hypothetical protein
MILFTGMVIIPIQRILTTIFCHYNKFKEHNLPIYLLGLGAAVVAAGALVVGAVVVAGIGGGGAGRQGTGRWGTGPVVVAWASWQRCTGRRR